LERT
jgi:hypothetical protein